MDQPKRPKLKLAEKENPAAKVLEKEQENPAQGLFVDLFSPKAADLVRTDTEVSVPQAPTSQPTIRSAPTVAPAVKPEVTSPSQLKNHQIKNVETRANAKSVSVNKSTAKQKSESKQIVKYALAGVLLLMIAFGVQQQFFSEKPGPAVSDSVLQQMTDRVSFHKNETGRRLNRERINVEYENQVTAPPIKDEVKPQPPDMMTGLPLAPEKQKGWTRDRMEAADPDFADNRIQYTLREQQGLNEWEERARKEQVEEFIANAAKAGYKVRVEKDGKVKVLGRLPTSESAPPTNSVRSNLPQ